MARILPLPLMATLLFCGCARLSTQAGGPLAPEARLKAEADGIREDLEAFRERKFRELPRIVQLPASAKCSVWDSAAQIGWVARKGLEPSSSVDAIFQATGLIRPGGNASHQRERMDCVVVKAMFQSRSRRIVVFDDSTVDRRQSLAHEMVHALQSEKLNLDTMLRSRSEPDAFLGKLGALEGEADFVADRVVGAASSPGCVDPSASILWTLDRSIHAVPQLAETPPIVGLPVYSPNVLGQRLACLLYARWGAAGLDTLLNRPPRGSFQLIHPTEYLKDVHEVDWDTAWSGIGQLPAGWLPAGQMRIGEVRLAALPLTWDRNLAADALRGEGLGWRGDRIWMARDREGRAAYVWRMSFSNPEKATEFGRLWWRILSIRRDRNLPAFEKRRRRSMWFEPGRGTHLVCAKGSDVLVSEGFDSLFAIKIQKSAFPRPR